MVPLQRIQFGEDLGVFGCDVCYCLSRCWGLVTLSFHVPVQPREVDTHPYLVTLFFGCDNDGCAPLGGLCDGFDYALTLQQLKFFLELIPVSEGDCSGCVNTEGFSVICQRDVELLSLHCLDVPIKHVGVFCHDPLVYGWVIGTTDIRDCYLGGSGARRIGIAVG